MRKGRKTASRKRTKSKTRRKVAAKKTAARRSRKAAPRKPAAKRTKPRASASRKRAAAPRKGKARRPAPRATGDRPRARLARGWQRGLGLEAGGQSGDTEGIPRSEDVDSESVEELLEEGQSWEAGIVSGVEHAEDEEGEVTTREVPEDDVPEEYRDEKG